MPLLTPISYSDYTVTDVFQFAKEIQHRTDYSRTLMVSLDIKYLFTNVPVAETIEIILSKFFLDQSTSLGSSGKSLQKIIEIYSK